MNSRTRHPRGTMRAITQLGYGGSEVLSLAEVETPGTVALAVQKAQRRRRLQHRVEFASSQVGIVMMGRFTSTTPPPAAVPRLIRRPSRVSRWVGLPVVVLAAMLPRAR